MRAEVTIIGSVSHRSHSWLWAWANRSITEAERVKASRLKGLYDVTGFDLFRNEGTPVDDRMPGELAAMSVHYLNALGCYRGPSDQLDVYYAIDQITRP